MGRPREYESGAARQRAWRERDKRETARVDRGALERLHRRLDALQEAVDTAARAGDEVARRSRAAGVDTVVEKLTRYFEESAREKREASKAIKEVS